MGKASLWHGNAPGECNNGAGGGRLKIATPFIALPSLPSAVAEWVAPHSMGSRQGCPGGIWTGIKASEARLRAEIKELRADNRALGKKMDRLVEILVTVKKA